MVDLAEMETIDNPESQATERKGKFTSCHLGKATGKLAKVNDRQIALIKFKGKVFAMDEKCPHLGMRLHVNYDYILFMCSCLCT